jgi:murein DD-endopeptidase MepM/ murein hydrolase activator NlpD
MRIGIPASLLAALLCALPGSAAAALTPGGAEAGARPAPVQRTGGVEYGAAQAMVGARPVLTQLNVPQTVASGSLPSVRLRVDERGVGTVALRVNLIGLASGRTALSAALGWVHTGRAVTVRWPSGASLAAGAYRVSVSGRDHHRNGLVRGAQVAGTTTLTVTRPPAPAPAPAPTPAPSPEAAPEAGVPSPAQSAAEGAVFPVAGAHNFGGPENRFGAPRGNHTHQGQDVLTEEGTPIVAPFAGSITQASYQAGAAGYYVVEHTGVGLDFMFAHCREGSLAVSSGQAVSAGQQLCAAGQSGDATTPHLHFEIWVGGWWAPGGHPIDPLPYLQAWEHH